MWLQAAIELLDSTHIVIAKIMAMRDKINYNSENSIVSRCSITKLDSRNLFILSFKIM